jgi:WD40 repeat protein
VHFSPDGKHLSTGSGDTTVRFWDLNTQTPYKEGRVHRAWVMACSWSPDAALLATGDKDGVVCLWEGATSECSGSCKGHTKWITSIAWQPLHVRSPCRCFATSSKDGTVRVWDAAKRAQLLCMAGALSSTGFSPLSLCFCFRISTLCGVQGQPLLLHEDKCMRTRCCATCYIGMINLRSLGEVGSNCRAHQHSELPGVDGRQYAHLRVQ